MKLWGGPSDTGCCSVADVDDARRVAQQLGIAHHVFNFSEEFERDVVDPYVADHAAGRTPNPCIECNRHLKFDRLLARAGQLGFDAVATGHHARVGAGRDGRWSLRRGVDPAKDQSYVLHMLGQAQLARVRLPVGELTEGRGAPIARRLGLAHRGQAGQPGRLLHLAPGRARAFLGDRGSALHPGRVVDAAGDVTVGLGAGGRAGHGRPAAGPRRLRAAVGEAAIVTTAGATSSTSTWPAAIVTVGPLAALLVDRHRGPGRWSWVGRSAREPGEELEVQISAHGRPGAGPVGARGRHRVDGPIRRVAPGQSVVLYRGDAVVGGGLAAGG